MKRFLAFAAAMLVLLAASGCAMRAGADLLKAPKPDKDNQAITDELELLKGWDGVYTTPYAGTNRNAVQMKDLDGDGIEEVVAFFQTPKGGNRFEAVVLGKRDEAYVQLGSIAGTGTQINSVSYPILDKTGRCGILICWQQVSESENRFSLAVCTGGQVRTLLEGAYSSILPADLDSDGAQELVVLNVPEGGRSTATIYEYDAAADAMNLAGEAPLSGVAKVIYKVAAGYIADRQPAVFAEERIEGGAGRQTDIFVYSQTDGLRNLALETESGQGKSTYRAVAVNAYDVNGDGMTEIPRAVRMVGSESGATDAAYMLDWYLYSAGAEPAYVMTTYRNVSQGWDFTISKAWHDAVRAVKGTENGSEYTCFVIFDPEGDDIPLLTVYYLLGEENRRTLDSADGMILLGSTSTATIAARIPASASGSSLALTEEQVKERFSLVAEDWNAPLS